MSKIPTGEVEQLNLFGDCLDGSRGKDQRRIASMALEWACLLLAKNADYGSSVWKEPILCPGMSIDSAIRVRLSDKIQRLRHLFSGTKPGVAESVEDTMRDLGAYCLLWLARPQDHKE